MSILKLQAPPQDPIEKDFLDALERLESGTPNNKGLRAKRDKGKLGLTAQNVAIEAGHSRTLISLENCRYPRVRELIRQIKAGDERPVTTHSELIRCLRADKVELMVQVSKYKAEATENYLSRVAAEKEAVKERAAAARLRKELAIQMRVVQLTTDD